MKLVFIHGAGEASLSFDYQLRHFTGSNGLDLPGHPEGRPCGSIEGYVEWVRGFLSGRIYQDVVLCGHSMGGAIAQLYALKYPEELRAIILVATGARLRVHPKHLKECEDGLRDMTRWLKSREGEYSGVEANLRQALLRRAAQVTPEVKLNDLLCCDRFDVMAAVKGISLPTQVICGSEDAMTPVKYSDYLAEQIPRSEKAVLDGATHYVQLERPREVNEIIGRFLAGLG